MSSSPYFDLAAPLTPSELVYLHAEQFANKVLVGNVELLHGEGKVSMAQLGDSMFKAAFLANEALGALHLQARKKKAVLGLMKVNALYADPGEGSVDWPTPSLEAELNRLAHSMQAQGDRHEVSNLIYAWLREDHSTPWKLVFEHVNAGLASRGLLEATEETKLKIFNVVHYNLPASTASLAASMSPTGIRQMLEACQTGQPDLWKLLEKNIQAAIRSRTEQDDDDFD